MNAKKRIEELHKLKSDKEKGIFHGIPVHENFPKLASVIPSINKGFIYLVTAASGVGKTQLTKYLFMLTPWMFSKGHPEAKINLKILAFLLEESEEEFIDSMLSAIIYLQSGVLVDPLHLTSSFREALDDKYLPLIAKAQPLLQEFLDHCEVVTSVYNTYGIYKYCQARSDEWGTHYYTPLMKPGTEFLTKEQYKRLPKEMQKKYKYSHYVDEDEDRHVLVVTDNMNLFNPDKEERDIRTAITNWSANFCKKNIVKHWNWTAINVQQQAADTEKMQYNYSGASVQDKVKPSLAGLGDNKVAQRDANVVIGLFAPERYKFEEYNKLDITQLRDRHRTLMILKNRNGRSNIEVDLVFAGECLYFDELPEANEMTPARYEQIKNL